MSGAGYAILAYVASLALFAAYGWSVLRGHREVTRRMNGESGGRP